MVSFIFNASDYILAIPILKTYSDGWQLHSAYKPVY